MAGASLVDVAGNAAAPVAIAGGGGMAEETPGTEGSAAAVVADGRQADDAREGFSAIVLKELDGEEGEEEDKWVGQYSSTQSILLVGEGDFSFSLALATGFGSGGNIVATSLDCSGLDSFLRFFFLCFPVDCMNMG